MDKKEDYVRMIEENSVRMLKKQNDFVPQFLLVLDDALAIVVMPMNDETKDDAVDALRKLITEKGCELYYSAMLGWSVNPDELQRLAKEKIKLHNEGKISFKEMMDFQESLHNRPTENPARMEILTLYEYDKKKGMRGKLMEVIRDGKKGEDGGKFKSLKKIVDWDDKGDGTMFSRFNVWSKHQVDL